MKDFYKKGFFIGEAWSTEREKLWPMKSTINKFFISESTMKGWFEVFRDDGGPTWYSYSNRTPVTGDVSLILIFVIFCTLFLAFIIIFPGIRKKVMYLFTNNYLLLNSWPKCFFLWITRIHSNWYEKFNFCHCDTMNYFLFALIFAETDNFFDCESKSNRWYCNFRLVYSMILKFIVWSIQYF